MFNIGKQILNICIRKYISRVNSTFNIGHTLYAITLQPNQSIYRTAQKM